MSGYKTEKDFTVKLSAILETLSISPPQVIDPEVFGVSSFRDATSNHLSYGGFPIMEHKAWLKFHARLARLAKAAS